MKKIKLVCAFGLRPDSVKMSPLVLALRENPLFETKVVVTAQHREQMDLVLRDFGIVPDIDLNIMKKGQSLADVTIRSLDGVGGALRQIKPDIVLVHGDTAAAFASALAAFYEGIVIGHVEAGLRTFNKREPFPEEINRLLVSKLADLHFAPVGNAKNNLIKEGIPEESVFVTGNTEIDAFFTLISKSGEYSFKEPTLNELDFSRRTIVMTAHRRENLGKPMTDICRAMARVVGENNDCQLVWPLHLNPEVRKVAQEELGGRDRVYLLDTLGVEDMFRLIEKCYMVATDSGGIQESAPALHKPVVVLRNVTERPEGVDAGVLRLGGNAEEDVYRTVSEVLNDRSVYDDMARRGNPFGDGKACRRIIDGILYYFNKINDRPEDFCKL